MIRLLFKNSMVVLLFIAVTGALNGQVPGNPPGDRSVQFAQHMWTFGMAFLVLFVVIIIFLILYRRFAGKRASSGQAPLLNVVEMKQKGLLTDEEMAMISHSLKRRMENEAAARQKKRETVSAADMLQKDPDVLSLLDKLAQKKTGGATAKPTASVQEDSKSTETSDSSAASDLNAGLKSSASRLNQMESADLVESGLPLQTADNGISGKPVTVVGEEAVLPEEISIPPEVQNLIDSGVLTPEEIEDYKQRQRSAQKNQTTH